jgi:hypothetical protein
MNNHKGPYPSKNERINLETCKGDLVNKDWAPKEIRGIIMQKVMRKGYLKQQVLPLQMRS